MYYRYNISCSVVTLRLGETSYTWSEGAGVVTVVIELIGTSERVISTTLQASPMSALGMCV